MDNVIEQFEANTGDTLESRLEYLSKKKIKWYNIPSIVRYMVNIIADLAKILGFVVSVQQHVPGSLNGLFNMIKNHEERIKKLEKQ